MKPAHLVLLACIACISCVDRPTPAGTDTDDTTTDPSTDSDTDEPTTGSQTWHRFAACQPSADLPGCPMGQTCCSEDPATVGGKLPNYYMDGVNDDKYGTPLFSDINNVLSHWGYCIDTSEFPSPLVNGCAVPCNPTWPADRIAEMCGTASCCQFTELDPERDCVMDGDRWRTARGTDIPALSSWGMTHTTNQDPFAAGCEAFALGDTDVLVDCSNQLTVADQRGFCFSSGCPCVEDVCDMKNPDWKPRCP